MSSVIDYPMTRQGVRDLDNPIRHSSSSGVNVGGGERTASTLAGGLLVGMGLARGGLLGMGLLALGGMLAYRGTTGHCSAYAATGINTAH